MHFKKAERGTIMRINVMDNDPLAYVNAIPCPKGPVIKDSYQNYYKTKLNEAADHKVEVVDFQGISFVDKKSEMFRNIGFIEEVLVNHIKNHAYPRLIRIICNSSDTCNLYKVVYNFYYADSKEEKMDVEE